MISVREVLEDCAEFIDGGSGVALDTPEGMERALKIYNRAVEEMMLEGQWEGTRGSLRLRVASGEFWCPSIVESVTHVSISSKPAPIRPDTWELISNGPGSHPSSSAEFRDLGNFGTAVDLPRSMRLAAWSDRHEDVTAYVHFNSHGNHPFAAQVRGMKTYSGERIQLVQGVGIGALPVHSTPSKWGTPTQISKPRTRGRVYVCGIEEDGTMHWLATLMPNEEGCTYRRYKIATGASGVTCVEAIVNLRYIPAFDDSEPALIQNKPAIRYMVMALAKSDINEMQAYKSKAESKLKKQDEKNTSGQTHRPVIRTLRGGSSIRSFGR